MLNDVTKVFKALSDSNRIRIIEMITDKAMCVCEITSILGLATSTVSKHLSILRDAGIIEDEKDGKWVNYRLKSPAANEYVQHLLFLMKNWVRDIEIVEQDRTTSGSVDRNQLCQG